APLLRRGSGQGWVAAAFQVRQTASASSLTHSVARVSQQSRMGEVGGGGLGPAVGVISMARSRWSLQIAKSDRLLGEGGLELRGAECPVDVRGYPAVACRAFGALIIAMVGVIPTT